MSRTLSMAIAAALIFLPRAHADEKVAPKPPTSIAIDRPLGDKVPPVSAVVPTWEIELVVPPAWISLEKKPVCERSTDVGQMANQAVGGIADFSAGASLRCKTDVQPPYPHDHIDLTKMRANGYELSSIAFRDIGKTLAGPTAGFSETGNINGVPFSSLTASRIRTWSKLDIRPVVYTLPSNGGAFSAYILVIRVKGPKGIDPVTGQKVRPSPVN